VTARTTRRTSQRRRLPSHHPGPFDTSTLWRTIGLFKFHTPHHLQSSPQNPVGPLIRGRNHSGDQLTRLPPRAVATLARVVDRHSDGCSWFPLPTLVEISTVRELHISLGVGHSRLDLDAVTGEQVMRVEIVRPRQLPNQSQVACICRLSLSKSLS
jgi:hypothetical protein